MFQAEWATPWGFIQLGGPRSSRLGRPRSPTEDSWPVLSITNADVHVDIFQEQNRLIFFVTPYIAYQLLHSATDVQ